jgi:recombinational DNA repair protein RecT
VTDYAEQARKTVLRRLSKMLPLNAEKSESFHKAIAHDNAQASGERSPIIDIPVLSEDGDEQVQAPKDRVTSLTERVAANGARVTHDTNGVVVEESK